MADIVQIPGGPELEFEDGIDPKKRAELIDQYTQRARAAMEQAEAQQPRMAMAPAAAGAGYGMVPQPQSRAEQQSRFETAREMGGMAARVLPYIIEARMSRGRPSPGRMAELMKYAGLGTLGEALGETIEPGAYRPGELAAAPIRGAVIPGGRVPAVMAQTALTSAAGGAVQRAVEGGEPLSPSEIARDVAVPTALVGAPTAIGRAAGFVRKAAERGAATAESIERMGVTPTVPQVFPEMAGVVQRAESRLGSSRYSDILAQQQRDLETQIARLPGGTATTPPSVQDVYKNAVELLGAPEVQSIVSKSTSATDAVTALQDAIKQMKETGEDVAKRAALTGTAALEASAETRTAGLRSGQARIKDYIRSTRQAAEAGQEALAKRAEAALPGMEAAGVAKAFPSGAPAKYEPVAAGYELEDLIGGKTGSLKSSWDTFKNDLYKNVRTVQDNPAFDPSVAGSKGQSLIDVVNSFEEKLPDIGISTKPFSKTVKEVVDGQEIPRDVSLTELRKLRDLVYSYSNYGGKAYGTPLQGEALQLADAINDTIETQAATALGADVADELLKANQTYRKVRPLWDSYFVNKAFADLKQEPGTMAEKLGKAIEAKGAAAPEYTNLMDLVSTLKGEGVSVPDVSRVNEMVRGYILNKAGNDRNKLANILTTIEGKSAGSLATLGLGDVAELNKFNDLNRIVEGSLMGEKGPNFKDFLTRISVFESRNPGSMAAWGFGSKADLDDLTKKFAQVERATGALERSESLAKALEMVTKLDTAAGYRMVPTLVPMLTNTKDIGTVMRNLETMSTAAASPATRKAAQDAVHNTRAVLLEDMLFGRTKEGVSKGLGQLDLDQLGRDLANKDLRSQYEEILGAPLLRRVESDLIPGLKAIKRAEEIAGGAGITQRGQTYGQLANLLPAAAIGGAGTALATGDVGKAVIGGGVGLATGLLTSYAGPAIASKFLSRAIGVTGLRNTAKTARMLEKLNDVPVPQAIRALTEYANTGKEPDLGTAPQP